ncbi:MAG: DUF1284 domain-containing protein [Methanomassiliicoccales archaeon]|nr:MAG: DUF1284 domain-containing protein [Methanomassiliicoccales archaeon]
MDRAVRLRPHHLLCIQFYQGLGYDDDFNENMAKVVDLVKGNRCSYIEVVPMVDDICSRCPENKGGVCTSEASVRDKDRSVLEFIEIKSWQRMTPQELERSMSDKLVTLENVSQICGECSWSKECDRSLSEHKRSKKNYG